MAVGTQQYEVVQCSLVICSIGYKSLPIDADVPTEQETGIIPSVRGRVVDSSRKPLPGEGQQ